MVRAALLMILAFFPAFAFSQSLGDDLTPAFDQEAFLATAKAELAYEIAYQGAAVVCGLQCPTKGDCVKQCQQQKAQDAYQQAFKTAQNSGQESKPLSLEHPKPTAWEG